MNVVLLSTLLVKQGWAWATGGAYVYKHDLCNTLGFYAGEFNPLAKKKAPLNRGALISFVWISLCVSVYALIFVY